MQKRTHIVLAEPSEIIRCGISALLQRISTLNVDIVELSDMNSVLALNNKHNFDILIVNPSHLGVFSPSQLRSDMGNDNLKIIALQNSFIEGAMLQNYDEVISLYDGSGSVREKIDKVISKEDNLEVQKELSVREKEIIVCVVKGMTNKQIADNLCLSAHTVITHRRNIANKLMIHSPSGLTIYAIVNKLVDLSEIKDSISQQSAD